MLTITTQTRRLYSCLKNPIAPPYYGQPFADMFNANRQKIVGAFAITVCALAVWAVSESGSDYGQDNAGAVAPVATAINGIPLRSPNAMGEAVHADRAGTTGEPSRPRMESTEKVPVFIGSAPPYSTSVVPQIAVLERLGPRPPKLSASYRSTLAGFRTCTVQGVPIGQTVTITNIANGRSITCVTIIAPADPIAEVVLHKRSFQKIADPTEAPINVEITF